MNCDVIKDTASTGAYTDWYIIRIRESWEAFNSTFFLSFLKLIKCKCAYLRTNMNVYVHTHINSCIFFRELLINCSVSWNISTRICKRIKHLYIHAHYYAYILSVLACALLQRIAKNIIKEMNAWTSYTSSTYRLTKRHWWRKQSHVHICIHMYIM